MPLSAMIVVGTRPEIIKSSPVIRAATAQDIQLTIVHTGQHYSPDLSEAFFKTLELPEPDFNFNVGSKRHGEQTAEIIKKTEKSILDIEPDVVLVQGDTNSTLGGGLAASKSQADLGHIEAGLRSFNKSMPEEQNRIVVDHVSDHLFAPTDVAAERLRDESIPSNQIFVTGNTIVDAVEANISIATSESEIEQDLGLKSDFALLTAHREENTDDLDRLMNIFKGISDFGIETDMEIIYPIHPRTAEQIETHQISMPNNIRIVDPLDYLDFLKIMSEASVVFTDSGGVQEEACILKTPCVTVRDETERPETVSVGANRIAGTSQDTVRKSGLDAISSDRSWESPLGDGDAGEKIVKVLLEDDNSRDFT